MKIAIIAALAALGVACSQPALNPCPDPRPPWIPPHHQCVMLPEHVACCTACDRMRELACNPFGETCEAITTTGAGKSPQYRADTKSSSCSIST